MIVVIVAEALGRHIIPTRALIPSAILGFALIVATSRRPSARHQWASGQSVEEGPLDWFLRCAGDLSRDSPSPVSPGPIANFRPGSTEGNFTDRYDRAADNSE